MRVAVLMGGPAPEHDVSIASGRAVHAALRGAGRDVLAVLVTRAGRFVIADEVDDFDPELAVHAAGFLEAMRKRDVAALFLALHGQGGEDGSIQAFLDWAGLPYTGAGFEASAVAMNKLLFKALIVEAGLPTPRHLSCSRHQHVTDPEALLVRARGLGLLPGFIKVANAGSSYGVHLVRDEDEARRALAEVFRGDGQLIWEERIAGREFTVPLCGEPEGEIEILPILEIRPKKGAFFDLASKYDDGGADEICPAPIDEALAGELRRLAVAVHRLLGLRGLSRTDFMVGEAGPMILETNTIPGLTAASLVPKALAAAGHDPADFYWSQLEAARARRRPSADDRELDLRLLAISPDRPERRERLAQDLDLLARGGVTAFMFREKGLDDDEFVRLGRRLRDRCRMLGLAFILNERVGLAEPIGAEIVHLTWRSAEPEPERRRPLIVGRSVHDPDEAKAVLATGLDYLIYGPVFATPSKEGLVPTQGLDRFAALAAGIDRPLIAIGGIEPDRVGALRRAGAAGVAAIRSFFSEQPEEAARRMRTAWEAAG